MKGKTVVIAGGTPGIGSLTPNSVSAEPRAGCVRAAQLDGERTLNLVLRPCGCDHRKRSIHREFGNSAPRRTTRSLYLEKRGIHEVARRRAESFIQPSPPIWAFAG